MQIVQRAWFRVFCFGILVCIPVLAELTKNDTLIQLDSLRTPFEVETPTIQPVANENSNSSSLESILRTDWHQGVQSLVSDSAKTAVFVMDKGEHALRIRAWLVENARQSLDIQYFIWSTDNVGQLALEALRRAAERGVQVRILVDDLMLEEPFDLLLALDAHPHIDIRIYNPNHTAGIGLARRIGNTLTDFRAINQRMHQKSLLVDKMAAIVGGRNMADEYYDFDQKFNFRDRDLLLAGAAVNQVNTSFNDHWNSPLSQPVSKVLVKQSKLMDIKQVKSIYASLEKRWNDTTFFAPAMKTGIDSVPSKVMDLLKDMDVCHARYIYDDPGKNDGKQGLKGGGKATDALAEFLKSAKKQVLVQTPYLILDDKAFALFKGLIKQGVKVRISTNSAANNDNFYAISGYQKQRKKLLKAGFEIRELKPYPDNMTQLLQRHENFTGKMPIFVLHAKTAVVDDQRVFIGTYNLDPRSQNLNTEAGVIIESPKLAAEAIAAIEADMRPENSWDAASGQGDKGLSTGQNLKLWFMRQLPLEPIL